MTFFGRVYRYFYALGTIKALEEQLELALSEGNEAVKANANLCKELEIEQARRISAEAIVAEVRDQNSWLRSALDLAKNELIELQKERLRSLDALNVKLMTGSVPETPDLEKFRSSTRQEVAQDLLRTTVRDLRAKERAINLAILQKFHPKFQNASSSEPQVTVPLNS